MEKNNDSIDLQSNSKQPRIDVDLANLTGDPFFRKKGVIIILVIETKSEEYIYKMIFDHDFSRKKIGTTMRRFNPTWFKKYKWLEYIIEKDAAYCLYCYLFKPDFGN